jgi:hypothetical protein
VPEEISESVEGEKCKDHILDRMQSTQSKDGVLKDMSEPL